MADIITPQGYTRYNYDTNIPTGWQLDDYQYGLTRDRGANTAAQGFDNLAIWLAPNMPYYETITPGPQQ